MKYICTKNSIDSTSGYSIIDLSSYNIASDSIYVIINANIEDLSSAYFNCSQVLRTGYTERICGYYISNGTLRYELLSITYNSSEKYIQFGGIHDTVLLRTGNIQVFEWPD